MSPSIEFLQKYRPDGPWLLVAISPDRKYIKGKTFDATTVEDAEKWVKKQNETRNVYFTVNPTFHPMSKKCERTDVAQLDWLHVDCDVQEGETYEEGMERIKKLMTSDCPTFPPTLVIFSGGGYQAFWKLNNPVKLDGTLEMAMDVARYNVQLERMFKGDNCHNIDRVMRLPFTTNWPNAKKVAAGRVPIKSDVFSFDPEEHTYDIEEFKQAPAVQTKGLDPNTIEINIHSVEELQSVDELDKWKVPDRIKIIIVQGYDEDNPKKPKEGSTDINSRSVWMFDVCCQLVRQGVPDEVIFGIITDPKFAISASILDKGTNAHKYATRQIQRAHEFTEEPLLAELNDRFIVIGNMGGRCRIMEEHYDPAMKRVQLTPQTFDDFKNRFSNQYVTVGDKQRQAGHWWLANPKRRQADCFTFTTGQVPKGAYNLWRGFEVVAKPGNMHHSFLEHIMSNICNNNRQYLNYLIGWLARMYQFPDKIGETAIVLRGKSGTGKSFLAEHLGHLLGRHYFFANDSQQMVGQFNAQLRDCVLLFADEAFYAGDKKHESVLKTLITSKEKNIQGKFLDIESKPNFLHIIMASNESWVVPTGPTERRFFVLDVSDSHIQDSAYFRQIHKDLENGGYENLLHFLLDFDITDFDVRNVPKTQALMEQKLHSLDPMHEWWLGRLEDGALLSTDSHYRTDVECDRLSDDYVANCAKFNITRRGSSIKLGRFLQRVCPGEFPLRFRSSKAERPYMYRFPPLVDLRTYWDALFHSETSWPAVTNAEAADLPF